MFEPNNSPVNGNENLLSGKFNIKKKKFKSDFTQFWKHHGRDKDKI